MQTWGVFHDVVRAGWEVQTRQVMTIAGVPDGTEPDTVIAALDRGGYSPSEGGILWGNHRVAVATDPETSARAALQLHWEELSGNSPIRRLSVRVGATLHRQYQVLADKLGTTQNDVVIRAMEHYLTCPDASAPLDRPN